MERPPRWPIAASLVAMAAIAGFFWFTGSRPAPPFEPETARGLRTVELLDLSPADEPLVDAEQIDEGGTPLDGLADASTLAQPVNPAALEDVLVQAAAANGIAPFVLAADGCLSAADGQQVLIDPASPAVYRCLDGDVRSIAGGRVLMMTTTAPESLAPPPSPGSEWTWDRGLAMGRFVVIDHGPQDSAASVISVYSRLAGVADLRVGQVVEAGEAIGSVSGDFMWELWVDDAPDAPSFQVAASTASGWAARLREVGNAPASTVCAFPAQSPALLPNADRAYRTGTHQGVDFNCGRGNDAFAYAPGQVVFALHDFVDPPVADRNAALANAAVAGDTPHWILAMLYGKFVAIDHGQVEGVGRVVTISAHLDSIDPAITVGANVVGGQRLGEIGNTGTNGGAAGSDASVHLHWELLVDGTHVANGLRSADTSAIYTSALCRDPEALSGC